jgi:hypothetical protein
MSEWEFRFVNMPSANGGEDWIELREIYYGEDGALMGHANPCLGSESMDGVTEIVRWWVHASKMPPLHECDFPEDFEPEAYL